MVSSISNTNNSVVVYGEKQQQCWCIKIQSASFVFLLPNIYVWVEYERVGDGGNAHTHRRQCGFFCETSLPFCFILLDQNLPKFMKFFWCPHNPWAHRHSSYFVCYLLNFCGTAVEEISASCLP